MTKGRNCSLAYMLKKDWAQQSIKINKDVLYIVGGLYGNSFALDIINKKAEKENAQVIFNGDMHWFDVEKEDFVKIEENSISGIKLLGNVEFELVSEDDNLGCGCNYPEDVAQGVVERSNIIHKKMKENLRGQEVLENIKTREKTLVVEFFDKKIAITHGDEKSMSGWQCSYDSLKNKERQEELEIWLNENKVDVLATTHTCLPALLTLKNNIVVNNGAAGMANVKNSTFGLITRIAKTQSTDAIISEKIGELYIELVKIDFSIEEFYSWFVKIWPEGSEASLSYKNRILNGASLEINEIKL